MGLLPSLGRRPRQFNPIEGEDADNTADLEEAERRALRGITTRTTKEYGFHHDAAHPVVQPPTARPGTSNKG